jgi:p-aminobenzoyl-glutamate transporter AbgT
MKKIYIIETLLLGIFLVTYLTLDILEKTGVISADLRLSKDALWLILIQNFVIVVQLFLAVSKFGNETTKSK